MKKKIFSIEEIISLTSIKSPRINKDASLIAYELVSADWKEDEFVKELWIYDVKMKRHLQVISKGEGYVGGISWSPDGCYLAMLCKVRKSKKAQIYVLNAKTMEKHQISFHDGGVRKFIWSADSKGFYYLGASPSEKEKKKRDEKYGEFTYIDEDKVNNALFYLDFKKAFTLSKKRYQLPEDLIKKSNKDKKNEYYPAVFLSKDKRFYIRSMVCSKDGKKLALTTALSPSMEDYENLTLYIYDIEKLEYEELRLEDFAGDVFFSPDSTKICFTTQESWLYNNKLHTYDFSEKKIEEIKLDIDENIWITEWNDKGILFYYQDKTDMKYLIIGEDIKPLLNHEGAYYIGVHATEDGEHITYIKKDRDGFSELFFDDKKLTNRSSLLKNRKYAKKELISWKSEDGLQIEGVLSIPDDFDSNKKYPLLVIVHGGPISTSYPMILDSYLYPLENFVEEGFIVLEPNYRGSEGYGEAFRKANYRKLGVGDYMDVISGVNHLIDLGYVDEDKMGIMGWSQGGYISAFCATYSNRFKAISVGAGISNWKTYFYNTDIPKFTKEYLGDVPFNDEEIYKETSPMTYIKKAQTPTLIQHGAFDNRVPVANAYELYRALKELKLNPKLVIYENMNHGPDTPSLLRTINNQNLAWFCHHLLGKELDGYYLKSDEKK